MTTNFNDFSAFTAPSANPYDPLIPAGDPARFFGREDIFAFVRQQLIVEHRRYALALIGQRGIGKTSTLLQMPQHLDGRILIAYVDLSAVQYSDEGGLLPVMADAARAALEAAEISTYRLPPTPADVSAAALETWFAETYLEVTLSALRNNRRLLFLFDETAALFAALDRNEIKADLPNFLSDLLARDERLNMLFALDSADESRAEHFAPLADPLLHRRLAYLDNAASESLIRVPAAPFYTLKDDAVSAIQTLTGGFPYLLHVVNRVLFERSAARDHRFPVTRGDVQGVLTQAIADADPIFRATWESAPLTEQRVLAALAWVTEAGGGRSIRFDDMRAWLLQATEEPVEETSLAAALRRLEYRETIRVFASRRYVFAAGLQQQWIIVYGNIRPALPTPVAPAIPARRAALPLIGVAIVGVLAVILIGRAALGFAATGNAPPLSPTVTLAVNIADTQSAVDATQTQLALPTATPTRTPTFTRTATNSPTATRTITASTTATFTATRTASMTATGTASITHTATPSITASATATPILSPTPSILPTIALSSTPTPTLTSTPTSTTTDTETSTATETMTPTATATATASVAPLPTQRLRTAHPP